MDRGFIPDEYRDRNEVTVWVQGQPERKESKNERPPNLLWLHKFLKREKGFSTHRPTQTYVRNGRYITATTRFGKGENRVIRRWARQYPFVTCI